MKSATVAQPGLERRAMSTTGSYQVSGMTCGHCVTSVKEEVGEIPGVRDVDVELSSGRVTVTSEEPIDPGVVHQAVADAGYEIVNG